MEFNHYSADMRAGQNIAHRVQHIFCSGQMQQKDVLRVDTQLKQAAAGDLAIFLRCEICRDPEQRTFARQSPCEAGRKARCRCAMTGMGRVNFV